MNYLIKKQKCPKCGRFRSVESPADLSVGLIENAWWCKHCAPPLPKTPERRQLIKELSEKRTHAEQEDT